MLVLLLVFFFFFQSLVCAFFIIIIFPFKYLYELAYILLGLISGRVGFTTTATRPNKNRVYQVETRPNPKSMGLGSGQVVGYWVEFFFFFFNCVKVKL